ncbi:MAG: CPBP family intramembrane metalloprotease [Bryobacterales bacterium]|nr:CPBP family intramembrane metalloprotease [Bryobacterales bacterium]
MKRHSNAPDLPSDLSGFGPAGLLAALVILLGNGLFAPLSALLVLLWALRSHTPWGELGFVRPRNWIMAIGAGVVAGVFLKLLMKALVMPLLGAPPVNPAFRHLTGNTAALPGMLYAVTIGAGFGEETVFRGYLFERLGKLFGESKWAACAIVILTSAWFGAMHYSGQGIHGVQQAAIVGLAFGVVYTRIRCLWPLIFAHAAFDVTALALIYWGVEPQVACSVFTCR